MTESGARIECVLTGMGRLRLGQRAAASIERQSRSSSRARTVHRCRRLCRSEDCVVRRGVPAAQVAERRSFRSCTDLGPWAGSILGSNGRCRPQLQCHFHVSRDVRRRGGIWTVEEARMGARLCNLLLHRCAVFVRSNSTSVAHPHFRSGSHNARVGGRDYGDTFHRVHNHTMSPFISRTLTANNRWSGRW